MRKSTSQKLQWVKLQVNEWTHKLRKEGYQLDRQIRGSYYNIILRTSKQVNIIDFHILAIQREEEKVKRTLKEAAKKGDRDTCIILAKEVLRARKAINKIYTSKAHMNSVSMQMKNQLGQYDLIYLITISIIHMKSVITQSYLLKCKHLFSILQ